MEQNAMFKLSYGLFLLSTKSGEKDNGCIINTVMQITDSPKRISIAVNKQNHTHDMIKDSGVFNVSILTTDTPFKCFEQFGFKSGRNTDKFSGYNSVKRSENGLYYLTEHCNAFISAKVVVTQEFESHTVFIAEVTQSEVLNDNASVTYQYYFDNIKPKAQEKADKKGFVCKICGYVYEGESLPPDFVCPLCKHGAEDFEPLA